MGNDIEYRNGKKEAKFELVEPYADYGAHQLMAEFQLHLAERATHHLGYHVNLDLDHLVALSPLLRFHINNVGDPFKNSNFGLHSKKYEIGVLEWFSQLWEIEKHEYWGYVTNGGTEGNLHGLLLGRELLPDGILYTSRESHYSIFKAARMFRMECKIINTLISGEIDCNDLRENLNLNNEKPAIINLNIGTTFKGGIDNLDDVIRTLEECGFSRDRFYIHCDAALLGLISPFLEQGPRFDFKRPIESASVSAHKLLGAPMPCGVFITRKKNISTFSTKVEYISTLDSTIPGSRNGLTPIFIWYNLNMKGRELRSIVKNCLMNAQYLRNRLKDAGISTMLNEMSLCVVFERPLDPDFVHHWQLSCERNMAHVVVMPHVTIELLDTFVNDLVQKRTFWYGCAKVEPPCLEEDIGISRCACSIHGKIKCDCVSFDKINYS